ncbi:MAG: flagellar protein FlgN [Phycisphaerales bacterium]|nr:flagellar protein FlgN [Phycisphaerales bacterium]
MDKLAIELVNLLREMLLMQQRILQIAASRQEAMRTFDIERLQGVAEQERLEMQRAEEMETRRAALIRRLRAALGKGIGPTVTEVAKHVGEPVKSQLLGLAGQLKTVVEQVDRTSRINAKVAETVVKGLAKVLKVVTGLAQHAGLYMRNGRKAAMKGIHLLDIPA